MSGAIKVKKTIHDVAKPGYLLIGAGGHAQAVVEAANLLIGEVKLYIDPRPSSWLNADRVESDEATLDINLPIVMGIGGINAKQLKQRNILLKTFVSKGHKAPPIVHPTAHVSCRAQIGLGAIVLAGAIVQPGVKIGQGVIINSKALIEHDCIIDEGAHVAPGAIILGGSNIGSNSMIGASSVVLPQCKVDADTLIPALTRFSESK